MSDDNTGRLKKVSLASVLISFCHNTPPLILYLSLYIIVKEYHPAGVFTTLKFDRKCAPFSRLTLH